MIKALDEALHCRGKPIGVIFHYDQGSQYKSHLVRQRLEYYDMRQSMSRKGNCWDHALIERIFRSLKLRYRSIEEAKLDRSVSDGILPSDTTTSV